MSVRPITTTIECNPEDADIPRDMWIMARSKIKYYGAYPAGFLERARNILTGGRIEESIWHIPGGMAHTYNGAGGMPLSGYGPNDLRIDLDPDVEPDIFMDIRFLDSIKIATSSHGQLPGYPDKYVNIHVAILSTNRWVNGRISDKDIAWLDRPSAIIIDLPYSREEAKNYAPGPDALPDLNETLKQSLRIVKPGGLVGVLDWRWPNGRRIGAKCILCATVTTGEGSRARLFTVWRKENA